MATFALIHGGGGSAWDWHLVAPALRERGHDAAAVDLPSEDESAGWEEYADAVVQAIGDRREVVVVGHSLGGFTAPLVCVRMPVDLLVLVAAMIPSPGELFADWWANSGYKAGLRAHDLRPAVQRVERLFGGVDLAARFADCPAARRAVDGKDQPPVSRLSAEVDEQRFPVVLDPQPMVGIPLLEQRSRFLCRTVGHERRPPRGVRAPLARIVHAEIMPRAPTQASPLAEPARTIMHAA